MHKKSKEASAVVVLPAAGGGRVSSAHHRRWLAGARPGTTAGEELLLPALAALGLPPPADGLAALRWWGQTGQRPEDWIAAADPVYLEPQRDRLSVHALSAAELPSSDLRAMFEQLQNVLATDRPYTFELIGSLGYLRSTEPLGTAAMSAANVPGEVLGDAMVAGEVAMHDRLQSELQMCLYESDVNQRRTDAGMRPVNALWFWGGGRASAPVTRALPRLFGDDPLFTGYWCSSAAPVAPWPGSVEGCLQASPEGFVAVTPDAGPEPQGAMLDRELAALHRILVKRRLRRTTLLFRDGLRADTRWSDPWRVWRRRRDPALEPAGDFD